MSVLNQTGHSQSAPRWAVHRQKRRPKSGSPLLVRVENIVLRLHDGMAGVPAVGATVFVGRERVGRGAIVERGISPSAGGRKPHIILLDEKHVLQDIRHVYGKWG